MENKIFKIILVVLSGAFLVGCSLDEKPIGLLSPSSFYSQPADFAAGMNGIYKAIYQGWNPINYGGLLNILSGAEDSKMQQGALLYMNFQENSQDGGLKSFWTNLYLCINNSNQIVSNAPNGKMSQNLRNQYEGEARFMRAWSYYYLVRMWGEVPIITTENSSNALNVGQSSIADVYAYIVNDLQKADTLLLEHPSDKLNPAKSGAELLLADVYLTMAGLPLNQTSYYAKAEAEVQKVISAAQYSLEPKFADLWKVSNSTTSSEIMFEFHGATGNTWQDGSNMHVSGRPGKEGGWSNYFSDSLFYAAFPAGPRKNATFHSYFIFFNNGIADSVYWKDPTTSIMQPYFAKYRDAGPGVTFPDYTLSGQYNGSAQGGGFQTIQRFAEAYLIYAEAANQAEGSPSATAYKYLNTIRRRAAGLDPNVPAPSVDLSGLSKDSFDKAVLDERLWEFAGEYRRWFDIVRRGLLTTAPIIQAEHGPGTQFPYHAYNVLFPKPASEILQIKGLTQNTGY